MADIDSIGGLLTSFGAPTALAFYVLIRVNNTLKDLTSAINKLATDNDKRLEKLESSTRELRYKLEMIAGKGGIKK